MATSTVLTNKPINPRGDDNRPVDSYNRASLYSGKALDFDGVNDYVTFDGFAGTLSNNDAWTACGYFKTSADGTRLTWFSAHNLSGGNIIRVGCESGYALGLFYADVTTGDVQISDFDFQDDKWHFVALSREQGGNSALITLFVDGIELASRTSGIDWDSATQFSLGQEYDGGSTSDFWNGLIGDFKIFNTALTAAQVADLYNNPEKIVPTGVSNNALKLWLPMMEGAGTTAYDGSGNGNHGTISGATWTHGVGSPVGQTAVIDWNKGTNLLEYSIWNNSYWTATGGVVTDGIEAPDGTNTAFKFERDDASSGTIYKVAPFGLSSTNYRYVYAKLPSGTGSGQLLSHNTNTNNTFTITDEWQRFELNSAPNTAPGNFYIVDFRGGVGVDEIHLWAPQAAAGTDESVFVPTIGTAQSSEVLLPQGLTTGRDITGVNLFENVRKQGALNLDGKSWAEVHDNASLDITDAITLEAWVYWDTDGATAKGIFGRWVSGENCYLFYKAASARLQFYINTAASDYFSMTTGWHHIVGTYDKTNRKLYVDGTLQDTDAYTTAIATSAKPLEIGRHEYLAIKCYQDGSIAQPRIYNRALTASEVLNNYNATKDLYI